MSWRSGLAPVHSLFTDLNGDESPRLYVPSIKLTCRSRRNSFATVGEGERFFDDALVTYC
jgi:hypothetical protein